MIDYILLEEYAKDIKVLFVEDDENIIKETSELLNLIFSYVDIARDGKEGLEKYLSFRRENEKFYDLVITDIKMPNMDGIELAKFIYKENKNQLLIVLSAHSETKYLLELVNIGISHFITKPLKYEEFVHVLYTKLKEYYKKNHKNLKEISEIVKINEELTWNKKEKELYRKDQQIKLTKKEVLLLEILLKYSEKTHTVEEILNFIWANEINSSPDISNLKNIISRMRKKVPDLEIENIYGFGYRINLK
ncbi:response regulator transcription factor [Halarcobacter anaerophilus]|jgi:DNA-binding response OmpR family regulator|uniref:DNA-binding response regulator n=1 Tax=Halarcobacter anaerophilus TaxID=877500 RepID=A0A4Q0Y4A6_9BACT|nr:response regulator transcription factor [Halarcobacter anaerophilus]QDF28909.1 two-component system response regulator, OmpR family [Halarcobacter anaerophilus]RXJ63549.1 DNA-binding response regulator [Halarcobacter anaerophilus]